MKKFEYSAIVLSTTETIGHKVVNLNMDELTKVGKEGWEIILYISDGKPPFFLAKREVE